MRETHTPNPSAGCQRLFTIGHSNLDFERLVALLAQQSVQTLIDVRSLPRSARFPQFSQPGFDRMLEKAGLHYLFLGEELGGRPNDPDAYSPTGVVDYNRRRRSYAFQAGIERVLLEAQKATCALICAEEDPLECHRFLMICPELVNCGIQPAHIRKNGHLDLQSQAEDRLLLTRGFADVARNSLFPEARAGALEDAYALQAGEFAYRVDATMLEL